MKKSSLFFFYYLIPIITIVLISLHVFEIITIDMIAILLMLFLLTPLVTKIKLNPKQGELEVTLLDINELEEIRSKSNFKRENKKRTRTYRVENNSLLKLEMPKKLDKKTILSKVRMDITNKLNRLASINGLPSDELSIGFLTGKLDEFTTLNKTDQLYLFEMLKLINYNLKNPDEKAVDYILDKYDIIIKLLDNKIEEAIQSTRGRDGAK